MKKPELQVPEGLHLFNPETAIRKLGRFLSSGADVRAVLDFDLTLTTKGNCWDPIYAVLNQCGQTAMERMRRRYVPLVNAGALSLRDSAVWSGTTFNLCAAQRPAIKTIYKHTLQIPERPGTLKMLDTLASIGALTEIHSAGSATIIREWLNGHGVSPLPHIVSTELVVAGGRVTGWQPNTFVHIASKEEWGRIRHEATKSQYPFSFVIGDGPHDIHMSPDRDNTFGIMVCDAPEPGGGSLEETLAIGQRAGFDGAVIGSLEPGAQLFINLARAQKSLGQLSCQI